jgi:hypothetical protein
MSSLIKRREEFTKIQTVLKKIFSKNRKKRLIKKIINLLRDKSFDEINAFETLFFFSACKRLVVDVHCEETNSFNIEKDQHQTEKC